MKCPACNELLNIKIDDINDYNLNTIFIVVIMLCGNCQRKYGVQLSFSKNDLLEV